MMRRKADSSLNFNDFQRQLIEKKERKALEELAKIMRKKQRELEKYKKFLLEESTELGKNDSAGADKAMQIDPFNTVYEKKKEEELALKKFEKYTDALKAEGAKANCHYKKIGQYKTWKKFKKMKKLDKKLLKIWEKYVQILNEKDEITNGKFNDHTEKLCEDKSEGYSGNGFGDFWKKLGNAFVKEIPSLFKTLVKVAVPLVIGIFTKDTSSKKQVQHA